MDNVGLDEDPAWIQNSGVSRQSQYTSLNQASRLQNVSEDRGSNVSSNASQSSQYAPLHPSTRSWEVPRQEVTLEKIIGKGAFGQVAKGTAINLRGQSGKTLVAIKKLKGVKCFKILVKEVENMLRNFYSSISSLESKFTIRIMLMLLHCIPSQEHVQQGWCEIMISLISH